MKDLKFDAQLIAARPKNHKAKRAFTDAVMSSIKSSEIFSSQIRRMNVNKKETLFMKLRHLPKIAIIAIAVGALALLTGTTYAVVKTVQGLSNVTVNESSTNEFGRKQLDVTLNGCEFPYESGTTYELKEGGELSAEDGVKALQARCDMENISEWIQANMNSEHAPPAYLMDQAHAITAITDSTVTLQDKGEKPLPQTAKVIVKNNEAGQRSDLKVGDIVIYYSDTMRSPWSRQETNGEVVIFKASQPAKYYTLEIQSYVNPRGPCMSNPERNCLKSNGINQTTLMVAMGGARHTIDESEDTREVQGRVVSYDAAQIKVDVGKGVIYTFFTTGNIIERYNQTTVYGLASFDTIYSKTDPEALKIRIGDDIGVGYLEDPSSFSHEISWNQLLGINLMVERIPNNLDVLRKY